MAELILALETSTPRSTLALADGDRLLFTRELPPEQRHLGGLFPALQALLSDARARLADLALFCFSQGPGSFTGLRVAATMGQTLHAALKCPVVGVPTLEVIARSTLALPNMPAQIAGILDARDGRLYGALFAREPGTASRLHTRVPTGLHTAAEWLANLPRPVTVVGEGCRSYAAELAAIQAVVTSEDLWLPRVEQVLQRGRELAAGGRTFAAHEIVPLYGRPPACEEVYEQRRAAARERRGE